MRCCTRPLLLMALPLLLSCRTPEPSPPDAPAQPTSNVAATVLAPDRAAAACARDRAVGGYLLSLPEPILLAWGSREMTRPDLWVLLEFSLSADGGLGDAQVVRANPPEAGPNLLKAMREASPFPPLGPARSCIAENRFHLLFRPGE